MRSDDPTHPSDPFPPNGTQGPRPMTQLAEGERRIPADTDAHRRSVWAKIRGALRGDSRPTAATFLGRVWMWIVYSRDVATATPPVPGRGWEFRPLSADEIRSPSGPIGPFEARQIERLNRFGESYAYGVFVEGQLAHVAWMLPYPADRLDAPRLLSLDEQEAEITACETVAAFRGRGIYPFAIQSLWMIARERRIHRVFMKTSSRNHASRSGMRKAGLERLGTVFVWNPPWDTGRSISLKVGPITLAK